MQEEQEHSLILVDSSSELPDASIFKHKVCEKQADSALQIDPPGKSQIDTFIKVGCYSQGAAIIEEYQKIKPLFLVERETRTTLKRRIVKRRSKHAGEQTDLC